MDQNSLTSLVLENKKSSKHGQSATGSRKSSVGKQYVKQNAKQIGTSTNGLDSKYDSKRKSSRGKSSHKTQKISGAPSQGVLYQEEIPFKQQSSHGGFSKGKQSSSHGRSESSHRNSSSHGGFSNRNDSSSHCRPDSSHRSGTKRGSSSSHQKSSERSSASQRKGSSKSYILCDNTKRQVNNILNVIFQVFDTDKNGEINPCQAIQVFKAYNKNNFVLTNNYMQEIYDLIFQLRAKDKASWVSYNLKRKDLECYFDYKICEETLCSGSNTQNSSNDQEQDVIKRYLQITQLNIQKKKYVGPTEQIQIFIINNNGNLNGVTMLKNLFEVSVNSVNGTGGMITNGYQNGQAIHTNYNCINSMSPQPPIPPFGQNFIPNMNVQNQIQINGYQNRNYQQQCGAPNYSSPCPQNYCQGQEQVIMQQRTITIQHNRLPPRPNRQY